jgi:tRNA (guanine37-N1)-methyltransferase
VADPGQAGDRLVVGLVTAPHGIRGAVKIESLTDDPTRFEPGSRLTHEVDGRALTVAESSATGRGIVVRFEEVADREGAEALRGAYLEAPAGRLGRGRYHWHEVEGARVVDLGGRELGTVREIVRAGGGEIAVVDGPDGEILVPLVRAFVRRFAPRRGRIVVDAERLGLEPSRPQATSTRSNAARPRPRKSGRRAEARETPGPGSGPVLEVDVLTLFPKMLEAPLAESIPGRVQAEGIAAVRFHDLRRWGLGRHRSVDDYTFGGGAGMVLRPEPVAAALDELRRPESTVVLLDAAGRRFDQAMAHELAAQRHIVLVCGRYEGVDERIRSLVDAEVSIGDVVLSGGEPAAVVIIDAVLRLLPGAIETDSVAEESFADGLLEYPQYTRPREFRGVRVPDVLISGDHGAVADWRLREALRRTRDRRPDLLERRSLGARERDLLAEMDAQPAGAPTAGERDRQGAAAILPPRSARPSRRSGAPRDRK